MLCMSVAQRGQVSGLRSHSEEVVEEFLCLLSVLRKPQFPFASLSFPFPRGSVVLASVKRKARSALCLAAVVCLVGSDCGRG